MSQAPQPRCSPELRAAHDLLVELVVAGSDTVLPAFDALVDAIVAYGDDDEEEALLAFDALVGEQLERFGDAWSASDAGPDVDEAGWTARIYAAAVDDFYMAGELEIAAARVRLRLAEMLLDRELFEDALPLLASAADELDTVPDLYGGIPRHLFGRALVRTGDRTGAREAFRAAAELSRAQDMPEQAADSFDELAELVRPDDPQAAVEAWREAARLWRLAGAEELAGYSEEGVGWATLDVIAQQVDTADLETRERLARDAYEIGRRENEPLAALAALHLVQPLDARGEYGEARILAEYVVDVGERFEDPWFEAMGWGMLAAAVTMSGAIEEGERYIRRALMLSEVLGDPSFTAQLTGMLAAAAEVRGDPAAAGRLYEAAAALSGGEFTSQIGLAADRARFMSAAMQGDVETGRRVAERIVAAARDDPQLAADAGAAVTFLLMIDLALGDVAAAAGHAAQLEEMRRVELATGNRYAVRGVEWMRPMEEALVAGSLGDLDAMERGVEARCEELLAEGHGAQAARLSVLRAVVDVKRNRRVTGGRHVPLVLSLGVIICGLPSSAERMSLRDQLARAAGFVIESAAALGDRELVAEVLETVRAQSVPVPLDTVTDQTSSIASLVASVTGVPASAGRPWAEQETVLPLPARVVMPWGATALVRYEAEALRYAPELAKAPRVRLVVPR